MLELAKALRMLRKRRRISQKTLAVRCGLTQQMVTNWEHDRNEPTIITLKELADFFGVSADFLLGRSDNPSFEYHLSMNEAELIEDYRAADEEKKKCLLCFAGFLKTQKPTSVGGNFGIQHQTSKSIMSVGGENVQNTINNGEADLT